MNDPQDPVKAQLIAARRAQILQAAIQVFAQQGFHRTTIRAIADVAGVSDGTIYNYFENKDALLLGILDQFNRTDERADDFDTGAQQDFQTFYTEYLQKRMALLWPNAEVFRAVLPEVLVRPDLRELYLQRVLTPTFAVAERYLQEKMDDGELRSLDVELTARAMAAQVFGLLMLHLLDDPVTTDQQADFPALLAEMLVKGVIER